MVTITYIVRFCVFIFSRYIFITKALKDLKIYNFLFGKNKGLFNKKLTQLK